MAAYYWPRSLHFKWNVKFYLFVYRRIVMECLCVIICGWSICNIYHMVRHSGYIVDTTDSCFQFNSFIWLQSINGSNYDAFQLNWLGMKNDVRISNVFFADNWQIYVLYKQISKCRNVNGNEWDENDQRKVDLEYER